MKQYLDIVKTILDHGCEKTPVRKDFVTGKFVPVDGGVSTIAVPNLHFSHEMSDGFPLLTTKKMAWKSLRVELEGFIKGITDKRWFEDRNCYVWQSWCDPTLVPDGLSHEERKEYQRNEPSLGTFYSYQWRNFGGQIDQLKNLVDTLHRNPHDRRMVVSAWNPTDIHRAALASCHWGWNVTAIGGKLHLTWIQRSVDVALGLPFNIASYGLLLVLLAKEAGLEPGNLSGMLVDCHLYENQIELVKEQVKRDPLPLPKVEIPGFTSIFDWTHDQVVLTGYKPHAKISFPPAVV